MPLLRETLGARITARTIELFHRGNRIAVHVLITSQLPVEAWHEVIDEPTIADAILDRLLHNAYRLPLDGPSMRDPKTAKSDTTGPLVSAGDKVPQ